jgi:uncharacterized protein with HEPN domain
MSRRDPRSYLSDIQTTCERLFKITAGKSLKDYASQDVLKPAVERLLEIIGEAVSQLVLHHPEFKGRITDERLVIGFRNRLIHGYFNVDDETVWNTVENDVPRLRDEVTALMQELK